MRDFTSEIKLSIDAILKLENEKPNKNKLFSKEKNICLRISLFKIPKLYGIKKKYLKLIHPRFGNEPEVCLFVPNRKDKFEYKISVDDSIEFTIDYYANLLEKHKVQGVKTIMPLKQLQAEYSPYELRRKLVNRFDLFLCKTSLLYNHRFIKSLGKLFFKSNKDPLGISFPSANAPYDSNFNESIKRAIFCTSFRIKAFSDNYAIPFGTLSHSKVQLRENLKTILSQIFEGDIIPGGFNNIRAMYLGTPTVGAVPLYICEDIPLSLPVPIIKFKRKGIRNVEGKITTLPGKIVKVLRSGNIIIKPIADNNLSTVIKEEIEEYEDDDEDFDSGSEAEEGTTGFKVNDDDDDKVAFKTEPNSGDSETDEDDEEIEKRELRLLEESRRMQGVKIENGDEEEDDDEVEMPPRKLRKTEKSQIQDKKNKGAGKKKQTTKMNGKPKLETKQSKASKSVKNKDVKAKASVKKGKNAKSLKTEKSATKTVKKSAKAKTNVRG